MTWELARDMDIDKYSALIAVGGDGTYHEVVNGMLHRTDKRRLPVAFIPNGSGNDTLRAVGVLTIEKALDYIVKGDLLKIDVTKILFDHETEDTVPQEERSKKVRYQLVNTCQGVPARINHAARHWKWCCCNAYELAAVGEFMSIKYDIVDVYLNEQLILNDVETCFLMTFTGKHTGNNMLINPTGVINDG